MRGIQTYLFKEKSASFVTLTHKVYCVVKHTFYFIKVVCVYYQHKAFLEERILTLVRTVFKRDKTFCSGDLCKFNYLFYVALRIEFLGNNASFRYFGRFLRYESGNEAKRQPIVPPTVIASEGTSINQSI